MGRNNKDFKGQILYHGTPAVLNPGDVIHAGEEGQAFATPNLEEAHQYGAIQAYRRSNLKDNTHHVYEVEPIGEVEVKYPDSDSPYYGSKEGLKVIRKAD